MSSFGRYCEVVRGERAPIGKRYKSIRRAAERYCSLTRTSFESVFVDLAERQGFRIGERNTGITLCAAAAELERARREFLAQYANIAARRRSEKRSGHKPPPFDQASLCTAISLGRPLRHQPDDPPIRDELPEEASTPEFRIGCRVRVIPNERNKTCHVGAIVRRVWHFKLHRWTYYIRTRSRKISKRYFAEDLEHSTE